MAGSGAGSSNDAPAAPQQPDFRTAAMVFQGLGSLGDDDIRVFLRAAGVDSSRRLLGLCHSVLLGLDGHYRARIQARDAILQRHHPGASMTTPSPSPAPGLGPTSKQAIQKARGRLRSPKMQQRPSRRSLGRLLRVPRLRPLRQDPQRLRPAQQGGQLEQLRARRLERLCQ